MYCLLKFKKTVESRVVSNAVKIEAVKVVNKMYLLDKKKKGGPKKRWFELKKSDVKVTGACEKDKKLRGNWKMRTRVADRS